MFSQRAEEFSNSTPVQSDAEKMVLAQQELLQAEADAERIRLMNEELKLNQEKQKVGADRERLKTIASKVLKQSEVDALHIAMAEQKFKMKNLRRIRNIELLRTEFEVLRLTFTRKPKTHAI